MDRVECPLSAKIGHCLTLQLVRPTPAPARFRQGRDGHEAAEFDCIDISGADHTECSVCTPAPRNNIRDARQLWDRSIPQCQRELRPPPNAIEHSSTRRFSAMPRRHIQLQPTPSWNMQLSWRRRPMAIMPHANGKRCETDDRAASAHFAIHFADAPLAANQILYCKL